MAIQTAEQAVAERGQPHVILQPGWPYRKDGNPNALLGCRNPIVGDFGSGELRFTTFVWDPKYARVRTLRLDLGCDQSEWLVCHWDIGTTSADKNVRKRLKSVSVNPRKYAEGARLLECMYAEDEDPEIREHGWAHWCRFQEALHDYKPNSRERKTKVMPWPESWWPTEIQRALKADRSPPEFTIEGRKPAKAEK